MDIQLPTQLITAIEESAARNERIVVMTCGVAGSGKSTISKKILSSYSNFIRLSIDAYIYEYFGQYGKDYPVSRYREHQEGARLALKMEFEKILKAGERDMVLDFSFWSREMRDEWRGIIERVRRGEEEGPGYRVLMAVFNATEEVLWKRIEERSRGVKDADSCAEVGRDLLASYVRGFERPGENEGEIIYVKVE